MPAEFHHNPPLNIFHLSKIMLFEGIIIWIAHDDKITMVEDYFEDFQESSCTTKLAPKLIQGSPSKHARSNDCVEALNRCTLIVFDWRTKVTSGNSKSRATISNTATVIMCHLCKHTRMTSVKFQTL